MLKTLPISLLCAAIAVAQPIPEMEAVQRLASQQNFKAAAKRAEELSRQHPDRWETYHAAAKNLMRIRRFRRAAELLITARQINPDAPEVLNDLAAAYYNQAQWSKALHYYRELDALAARDTRAQGRWQVPYHRGVCAERLELVQEAIEAYNRALNMTSGNSQQDYRKELEIRDRMAGVMLNSGRTKAAVHHFTRLVESQPTNGEFQYYLGVARLKLGDTEDAEEALLAARRLDPEDPRIDLRLGKLYNRTGDIPRALTFFQQAVEKNPKAYEPWYSLRQLYIRKNDLDQADEAHARYQELHEAGRVLEEQIRQYRRTVKNDPFRSDVYIDHALLLIQNGRFQEGLFKLQQLLGVDPDHEIAIINVAQLNAQEGHFQDAVYELDKILERDPGHPVANFESARSLLRLGRLQPAYSHLTRSFGRADREEHPGRYVTALQLWAHLARHQAIRRPMDPIPEFEKAMNHWSQDRERLAELIAPYMQLCAQAGQTKRMYQRVQDVLPVLGEEHPRYGPTLQLAFKIAQLAKDNNMAAQYERMLIKLGQ